MTSNNISPKEFETGLKGFCNRDIHSIYYIIDCIVVLKAGKKYKPDNISHISESEFELYINGNWTYISPDNIVLESTRVDEKESFVNFRSRIDKFISSLKITQVKNITLSEDGQSCEILLDNLDKFVVEKENDLFVSFHYRDIDENNKFVSAIHFQVEENQPHNFTVTIAKA